MRRFGNKSKNLRLFVSLCKLHILHLMFKCRIVLLEILPEKENKMIMDQIEREIIKK